MITFPFLYYFSFFLELIFDLIKFACFFYLITNCASYINLCLRFSKTYQMCCQFHPLKEGSSRVSDNLQFRLVAPPCSLCIAVILGFLFPVTLGIPSPSLISIPYCCNYCGFIDI